MKDRPRSREIFERAQQILPGGVNSPVRAFRAVNSTPPVIQKGSGSQIYDVDGNCYVDFVGSWGPLILGHAHPKVIQAIISSAGHGTSFGALTEAEIEMAGLICKAMPSIEKVRMVNSGTEATMSALRLARAFTRKDKIIKFAGGYHGHSDGLLVKAGSGATTLGVPDSPGIPAGYTENTLVADYNDLQSVATLFELYPGQIAAVIVEPVAANMGVIRPRPDFLPGLREITREHGALLIFDEVITGFRLAYGGAQSLFGITPDITCLGKIIGGGLPVGAYGGRRDIMSMISPEGPVYQAGTLSGNPVAMAAGLETLRQLSQPGNYAKLEAMSAQMETGIRQAIAGKGVQLVRQGSLLTLFFSPAEVYDYKTALNSDTHRYAAFFNHLLDHGIYWPPSQYEAAFISLAHTEDDIQKTVGLIAAFFNHEKR
jgi:glutamate-1-semialdehyde 2,1-aminomutase